MKTNLSTLMSIATIEEGKFANLAYQLKKFAKSITTQELGGTINTIEDYKEDFKKTYEEYERTQIRISKIKKIIHKKNAELKLEDGRNIQEAIIDNTNLRKMKSTIEFLLTLRNSKKRITEVNNSYFECETVNYDLELLEKRFIELEKEINNTDFQISKLNSIEFETEL